MSYLESRLAQIKALAEEEYTESVNIPALVAALEIAVGALEAVSNGHTVFELAEDQSGFSGDIVKTEMKKLITPETDKARQALKQIGAALGIEK